MKLYCFFLFSKCNIFQFRLFGGNTFDISPKHLWKPIFFLTPLKVEWQLFQVHFFTCRKILLFNSTRLFCNKFFFFHKLLKAPPLATFCCTIFGHASHFLPKITGMETPSSVCCFINPWTRYLRSLDDGGEKKLMMGESPKLLVNTFFLPGCVNG